MPTAPHTGFSHTMSAPAARIQTIIVTVTAFRFAFFFSCAPMPSSLAERKFTTAKALSARDSTNPGRIT